MNGDVHLVDVFTLGDSGGNPLAVVVHEGDLDPSHMPAAAREQDVAETAFVSRAPVAGRPCPVRVFRGQRVLPFSGHGALGAGNVLREHVLSGRPETVDLEMPLGDLRVRFESGHDGQELAWLSAPTIEIGSAWPGGAVYEALGLRGVSPAGLPPTQLTGAGLPVLIVPVPGLPELQACALDGPAFRAFAVRMVRHRALTAVVYAFCSQARDRDHHLAARLFLAGEDELEDPASGTAAVCLGAYLQLHEQFAAPEGGLLVEQGYEMGRPSLLRLRWRRGDEGTRVEVGGTVRPAVGAGAL